MSVYFLDRNASIQGVYIHTFFPQAEILCALREHIQDTSQQKAYLDHLINVVIETTPELLERVDERIGLDDHNQLRMKERSVEYC